MTTTQERHEEPGNKHDAGKAAIDLIDPEFIKGLGAVLEYGARKYGERNWEQGMTWGRILAATQRHILQFWAGEELDDESKLHHLHHAAFGLMVLAAFDRENVGTDNRSKLNTCGPQLSPTPPDVESQPPKLLHRLRKFFASWTHFLMGWPRDTTQS